MFYKIYLIKVKIVHFFIVNQDVVLVSLMRTTLCFSAACANDLIERPVAFGRKLSTLKPNECKVLQLLNVKRKLTNSTRAYSIAGGFDKWCKVRKDLGVGQAWTRCTSGHGVRQFLQLSSSILMDQWFKVVQDPPPS